MTRTRRRIVTRWERVHAPDGYDSTHFGRLEITTRQPAVGSGWTKCVVDVSTPHLVYISKEAW